MNIKKSPEELQGKLNSGKGADNISTEDLTIELNELESDLENEIVETPNTTNETQEELFLDDIKLYHFILKQL